MKRVVKELGLDPDAISVREVDGEDAARNEEFYGSPTIRIDGYDIQQPNTEEHIGLACRIYHLRDGRVSPTPDPDDLKEALIKAIRGLSR